MIDREKQAAIDAAIELLLEWRAGKPVHKQEVKAALDVLGEVLLANKSLYSLILAPKPARSA